MRRAATFAIGPGETSQLQGITQGSNENFRHHFGMVNIVGGPATVHVALKDHSGMTLGQKDYTLLAFEALQYTASYNAFVGRRTGATSFSASTSSSRCGPWSTGFGMATDGSTWGSWRRTSRHSEPRSMPPKPGCERAKT